MLKHTIFLATSLFLLSCSSNGFQGGSEKTNQEVKPSQSSDSQKTANSDNQVPSDSEDLVSEDGVKKIQFTDSSGAIMFRGTRGINLVTMEVGIPLNPNDESVLKASKGLFVASGLRTGSNFNDWGMFAKSTKATATATTNFIERHSNCEPDEIAIGLPDRGVDATPGNPESVPGWRSRLVCAKIASGLKMKQIFTVNYTHGYSMSVDCPGNSLLNGYDCGTCAVPSPAVLKCIEVEKK